MNLVARIAAGAAALVLMGQDDCGPPSFEHPLSAPESSNPDPRLIGTWYGTCFGKDEACLLHVFTRETDRLSLILVMPEQSQPDAVTLESFVSRIGDRTYLNAGWSEDGEGPPTAYLIARYELGKNGMLVIRVMRERPVNDAIAAGELARSIGRDVNADVADVASPTDRVAAFVSKADEKKLFEHFGTFRKVRLPEVKKARPR